MAKCRVALTLKLQTNKQADIETRELQAGDVVTITHTFEAVVLIRDAEGHYYNVPKDKIEP